MGSIELDELNNVTKQETVQYAINGHNDTVNLSINDHDNGPGLLGTQHAASLRPPPDPVAICGLAMRLPGGVRDEEQFWNLLYNGMDARSTVPPDRYDVNGFDESLGKKSSIKSQYGYFLDEDLSRLDASFFSLSKSELEKVDPQQRQLLEVTRECLESAGEVDYRGKSVGCYVGTFSEDWLHTSAKETMNDAGYVMTGYTDLMLANRVSYEYDFRGPSMVIKTGCSASLVGLHEAFRALQNGDCAGAIVAGTSLITGPTTTIAMTSLGLLSPEGSCKTFDSSADGFARAEAINAVYVKRLDDAIRDGNPIRAVIRNTGANSDGKSQSLMSPSGEAHEALMRKVYAEAALQPAQTGYVECHGTGTPVGDPIEATAIGNVFGQEGVLIGSVKPNVGHSEGASGITSLIKAVLSLEHNIIPPNIKFNRPNPKIPFAEKNLEVPITPTPWPKDRAERISVNSFGIGGTNAHAIIDSFNDSHVDQAGNEQRAHNVPKLLLFSANTRDSLQRQLDNVQKYIEKNQERLSDVSYTLCMRREHLPHRTFSVLVEGLRSDVPELTKIPGVVPKPVMVFSGQGAQWAGMGADLILNDSSWRHDIRLMDSVLQCLKEPPTWTIEDELQKPADLSQLDTAELSQPLCTAIQIAQVNALARCGVRPTAVVGHSSGEIAAAYASGFLSMPEAILVAYYRGLVTKSQTLVGGMAAIGFDTTTTSSFLTDGVVIACENSPTSTTISGDHEKLDIILERIQLERPGVLARKLKVNMAYHSHHMKALEGEYLALLKTTLQEKKEHNRHRPYIPFFSSVSEDVILDLARLGPEYWISNLISPVRFYSAVENVLQYQKDNIFLEIGPHSTLAGPLRQICAKSQASCSYIATMIRNSNSTQSFLSMIGQLYQHGIRVNFESINPPGRVLYDLPAYPWDHSSSFWYESRVSKDWRFRSFGHHILLGQRIPESTTLEPAWRNILSLDDAPWLSDHKVRGDIIFPFAGYITMAGEAVRQVTGIDVGYSLQHVVAHSALVLTESKPVEIMTTLRPHRLTDSANSQFYDFCISHYSGSTWIKNCEGQIKPADHSLASPSQFETLPRRVEARRWYEALERTGIVYGPEFQLLMSISSSTTENLATATVSTRKGQQEAPFLFHPAAMDSCLQLFLVALTKGIGRSFSEVAMPTLVEQIVVFRSAETMQGKAWSFNSQKDGGFDFIANGKTVLQFRGLHLTALDEASVAKYDKYSAARLEWSPDFDFLDPSRLFAAPKSNTFETQLQEEMTFLCIIDSAERLRDLLAVKPHFNRYRDWLQMEILRAEAGTYPVVTNVSSLLNVSRPERIELIKNIHAKLLKISSKSALATGTLRVWENAETLFTGKADTLDILMEDDTLTKIYDAMSFGHGGFVRKLSISKPNLRILEVGAGTGGTTAMILRDLVAQDCDSVSSTNPAYSVYTFTDISAGFFPQAAERFAYAPNMEYKVFDISRDPFDQAFEPHSYDLILAPNVVHATASLNEALCNLQRLLKEGGCLVLTELCGKVRAPNYIFGHFDGWWLGESDNRPYEPYVPVDRWDRELKAAGFSGADTVVYDADLPERYCAVIVSRLSSPPVTCGERSVTILCDQPDIGIAHSLLNYLEKDGFAVSIRRLGEVLPPRQNIVCTLDLESHFFENISGERLSAFQKFLEDHNMQKILWLTEPAQILCKDPGCAQAIGIARTIRSELAIPFFTLEIDREDQRLFEITLKVLTKISNCKDTENLAPDYEFAVHDGVIKISRYHPFSVEEELRGQMFTLPDQVTTLEIPRPGLLDTLHWTQEEHARDINSGQVEIEATAIGLNFRDIVLAMGIISVENSKVALGLETTGYVRRVGSNVHNLAVGDRVLALAPYGCIKTHVVLPASLCARIPDDLSFEDAATIPICFTTAFRSLVEVGQLEKGQTVLIHSATGGVGHAAIQICKLIEAEIFVTVGNEEKRQYLIDNMGIPKEHIFNSRDDSFYTDLMRETSGRGVDLVLNSLSGELLHKSWQCVAEFGRLVELGKRDLAGFGQLDMRNFLENRSYCCVDIAHLIQRRPEKMGRMLQSLLDLYSKGEIQPLRPVTVFEAVDVKQAFRLLQKGDHIGKIVIRLPGDVSSIPAIPRQRRITLDPQASYLLVGGLGGLGRSIATWLVERGAKSLVFLSRSAGSSSEHQEFFKELDCMGCLASAIAGEVQDKKTVEKAVAMVERPIRGVIHLAMVLQDAALLRMTHDDWTAAIAPKVNGAWNLHDALFDHQLDFFFLASTLNSVIEQTGQANYLAASTFLEGFCQHRHSLGLPASVLNICPIEGVGYVADNASARKSLKAQGIPPLGEREFLDYLELALLNSYPRNTDQHVAQEDLSWKNTGQIIMNLRSERDLDDPNNPTNWRRDRRMGTYHNIKETSNETTRKPTDLRSFLTRANDEPDILAEKSSIDYLAYQIGQKVFDFMLKPDEEIDISLTLTKVGLDSLMAIELRRWWKQAFGLEISVLEIMGSGTLEELGKIAAERLKKKAKGEDSAEKEER